MFKKLRTIVYHANNMSKAKELYAEVTYIQPYFDEPFYVGFDINGFELGLDNDTSLASEGNHAIAYWSFDDIENVVERLMVLGAKIISPVIEVGGNILIAIVQDPFGNAIGLIEGA